MVSPKGALGGAAVGFKTQTVLFMFVCNKATDKGTLWWDLEETKNSKKERIRHESNSGAASQETRHLSIQASND